MSPFLCSNGHQPASKGIDMIKFVLFYMIMIIKHDHRLIDFVKILGNKGNQNCQLALRPGFL